MAARNDQFSVALQAAFDAAKIATEEYHAAHGQHFPCGFSWVKIKPARGALIEYLREKKIGRLDDFNGGWIIYNPSNHHTQCMEAKAVGSRAFVETLTKSGVLPKNSRAFTENRMD